MGKNTVKLLIILCALGAGSAQAATVYEGTDYGFSSQSSNRGLVEMSWTTGETVTVGRVDFDTWVTADEEDYDGEELVVTLLIGGSQVAQESYTYGDFATSSGSYTSIVLEQSHIISAGEDVVVSMSHDWSAGEGNWLYEYGPLRQAGEPVVYLTSDDIPFDVLDFEGAYHVPLKIYDDTYQSSYSSDDFHFEILYPTDPGTSTRSDIDLVFQMTQIGDTLSFDTWVFCLNADLTDLAFNIGTSTTMCSYRVAGEATSTTLTTIPDFITSTDATSTYQYTITFTDSGTGEYWQFFGKYRYLLEELSQEDWALVQAEIDRVKEELYGGHGWLVYKLTHMFPIGYITLFVEQWERVKDGSTATSADMVVDMSEISNGRMSEWTLFSWSWLPQQGQEFYSIWLIINNLMSSLMWLGFAFYTANVAINRVFKDV